MPARLQRKPKIKTEISAHFSKKDSFFHLSFKWKREGRRKVIAAPVTLPDKPINRAKCGVNMDINRVNKRNEPLTARASSGDLKLEWLPSEIQEYTISVAAKKGKG